MKISYISHRDPILKEVITLGKKNSKTLGLFPEGAFEDYARKKNIAVAIEGDKLLGYVLFRITQRTNIVSIVHLCISSECRRQGVAKQLLDSVKDKFQSTCIAIALSCREDYLDASKFWEKYGFKAKDKIKSRSKDEKYLIKWRYDFGNPDLFTSQYNPSKIIRAVIDANIIIKLRDASNCQELDVLALNADWLVDDIDYYFAPEMFNEINRDQDKNRANSTRNFLLSFNELLVGPDQCTEILKHLEKLIPGDNHNIISDRKQLSECIAGNIKYFITLDKQLLNVKNEVYKEYLVNILTPAEFIISIDQLINQANYISVDITGTRFEYCALQRNEIEMIIQQFQHKNIESASQLRTIINNLIANIKNTLIQLIKDSDNNCFAFFAAEFLENNMLLKLIRTRNGKVSSVFLQQILHKIHTVALDRKLDYIIIEDKSLSEEDEFVLDLMGFYKIDSIWRKIVISGIMSTSELLIISRIGENIDIVSIQEKLNTSSSDEANQLKMQLEKKLWPVKLNDIDIPVYIIPIRPYWAGQLFDYHLSGQDLFGAPPELLWRRENIYYRNVKPVSETVPARILWYISKDHKSPTGREQGIVASSYLEEVYIDQPKVLFKKFEKYGIYKWKDVYKLSGSNIHKKIKALRFAGTEVFEKHIKLHQIQEIMLKHGKPKNTFASPVEVSYKVFIEIYDLSK